MDTIREDPNEESEVTLDWIREQKKAELHVHLLGAIRPKTALEIARKNQVDFPVTREEDWVAYFSRGDLGTFVEGFISLFEIIKNGEELRRVALEAAEDWAKEGIRYTEPRVTLTSHLARGLDPAGLFANLDLARIESHEKWGLEICWIVDVPRILGVEVGRKALESATQGMNHGVVGLDIAGYEGSYDDDLEWGRIFREARKRGLHTTAHAGEIGSADHVRTAIEVWEVERIGHGVRAAEEESVMALLRERAIPVETNPTCNVVLGSVPSLADHPLEVFRRTGIPITVNTDDPSLFGITLSEEIFKTAAVFGWSRSTLLEVIENGWKHRFDRWI